MSFVERHKTWLLPLLAVGVGAVIWYDLGSLGAPAPSPAAESAPAAPAPASTQAAPALDAGASAPTPAAASRPPLSPEAWSDLGYLNSVPGSLALTGDLATRATRPLDAELLAPPASGGMPLQIHAPAQLVLPSPGSGATAPPPDLDFISRTPEGLRAWYQGLGFRTGETLLGTSYRIREIRPPRVVLEGPAGPVVQSTVHLAAPAPSPETP